MTTRSQAPKQSLFVPVSGELKRREIISLAGETKSGKTDWALRTAPEPVYYICYDTNGVEVARKIKRQLNRDIRIAEAEGRSKDAAQDDYKKQWAAFTDAWYEAVESNQGTLIVDTWSEAYEEARLSYFGKTEQVLARNYGPVNADLKIKMRDLIKSNLNAVLIAKMRDEYIDDKRTGNRNAAFWPDTKFQVDTSLEMYRVDELLGNWDPNNPTWNEETQQFDWPYRFFVVECRNNMTLTGREYTTYPFGMKEWIDEVYG